MEGRRPLSGVAIDEATGDLFFTDLLAGKLVHANASKAFSSSVVVEGAHYLFDVDLGSRPGDEREQRGRRRLAVRVMPDRGAIFRARLGGRSRRSGRRGRNGSTAFPKCAGSRCAATKRLYFVASGTVYTAPLDDPQEYTQIATGFGDLMRIAVDATTDADDGTGASLLVSDWNASAIYSLSMRGTGRKIVGYHSYPRAVCLPPSAAASNEDASAAGAAATSAAPSAAPASPELRGGTFPPTGTERVFSPSATPSLEPSLQVTFSPSHRPIFEPMEPSAGPSPSAARSSKPVSANLTSPPTRRPTFMQSGMPTPAPQMPPTAAPSERG